MTTVSVFVCGECKHRRPLVDVLRRAGLGVEFVACQKVCDGPVAGVVAGGRLEWFERLEKEKHHRALAELATAARKGPIPEVLARRRLKKRSGRRPR